MGIGLCLRGSKFRNISSVPRTGYIMPSEQQSVGLQSGQTNMALSPGCARCNQLSCVSFSIKVDSGRVATHTPQHQLTVQGKIRFIKPPTSEYAPTRWYLTPIGNGLLGVLEELLDGHRFNSVFCLADSRVTITIERPVPMEEASTLLRHIRTFVYDHPFMLKAELQCKDWYSDYDGAWIVKIDDCKAKAITHKLLEGTGLVWTERLSWEQHRLWKCKGKYESGSDAWRKPLRRALGADEELMSASEVVERVSCTLEQVGPAQQVWLTIAKASCVCALQRLELHQVAEEEV